MLDYMVSHSQSCLKFRGVKSVLIQLYINESCTCWKRCVILNVVRKSEWECWLCSIGWSFPTRCWNRIWIGCQGQKPLSFTVLLEKKSSPNPIKFVFCWNWSKIHIERTLDCWCACVPSTMSFSIAVKLLQAGTRGHRGGYQHESGRALGQRALRRDRPSQVAVWRVVAWCHAGQSHGVRRPSRVSDTSSVSLVCTVMKVKFTSSHHHPQK